MNEGNAVSGPQNADSGLRINKKTILFIAVILFAIMAFVGTLSQTVPRGVYAEDADGKIIDGTYELIDYKMPVWKIVLSPIMVFTASESVTGLAIIIFIILIGGTFLVLDKCGALKYIMASVVKRFGRKKYLMLCVMVFIMMALSSVAGILEESVTLVPIAAAIALALGWDSFVGLSLSLVAIAFGFTAATFNPFNVLLVQRLAGLDIFSGLWYRIIVFIVIYIVFAGFLVAYAKKIEKDPKKSIAYESDKILREKYDMGDSEKILADKSLGKAVKVFALCLSGVFVMTALDFAFKMEGMLSMPSMALLFTAGGLSAGAVCGLRGKNLLKSFFSGAKAVAPVIPLLLFILAITYILREGRIIHTLLYHIYNLIAGVGPYSAILLLCLIVIIFEFFIGSGTAKAFLMMPILLPLTDLIGVERQAVVLSFCLGDGFTNILYPTSGIMIIAIGLVGISYRKWLKFSWKLFLMSGAAAAGLMLLAVFIGYH
ncbi:MAG: AbgT family transporter [Oscillospiraceae bacterium]|nr:AbgT family transporter [Oscillospiraceae bacterium]